MAATPSDADTLAALTKWVQAICQELKIKDAGTFGNGAALFEVLQSVCVQIILGCC